MALRESISVGSKRFCISEQALTRALPSQRRRYASQAGAQEFSDLEASSFQTPSGESTHNPAEYDPVGNARIRQRELPSSRYHFRSPKYYRGPLHPHQPPPPSDPASREFRPGPFSLPRLEQTYTSTISSDLMTLNYAHYPPGTEPAKKGERLRAWVGDSPYFKNRPLRGPRGASVLPLLRKRITFRNVPRLERVTVHSMVKEAKTNSANLHVAGMIMQAITNVRATAHEVKASVAGFNIRAGQHLSVSCDLYGEDMYHFLSKVIDVVMPRIKEYKGVKGSSGDSSGNIAFGLSRDDVALFPEVEVNYDMYPPAMIPGCHVMIHTSATTDREARMLLTAIGIPFHGKLID